MSTVSDDEFRIHVTGSATHAPDQVRKLAERLGKTHNCKVNIAKEASGYHIYMPCPDCLETHGDKELGDPKFAINASKYLGLGESFKHLTDDPDPGFFDPVHLQSMRDGDDIRDARSGICMRTCQSQKPHRYRVSELLAMSTITERFPDIRTSFSLVNGAGSADKLDHWEDDPITGKKCPPPPGKVIPIHELPSGHPAAEYLLKRGYDLKRLYDQFRVSFCTEEYPHGKNGIFYRKMPGGWKDTPQNRIIFYALHGGVPMTWQGRFIERESPDGLQKYALSPYRPPLGDLVWDHVATRSNAKAPWMPIAPFDELDDEGQLRWKPSKYRTAKYSERELMGWDAAIARAQADPDDIKWCVLNEGPLDAARWGPGGIAVIGKSISAANAIKVVQHFHIVFTGFDNDTAGKEATRKVASILTACKARAPMMQHVEPLNIPGGKDPGDLEQAVADQILAQAVRRAKRAT